MMKTALGASSLALALATSAAAADQTKTFPLADFDRIEIAAAYELDATVGPDFSVTLVGSAEDIARAELKVVNGELSLGARDRRQKRGRDQDGLKAIVSMPKLTAISVSGVVDGEIKGIAADAFEAKISGVGELRLDGSCKTFEAMVSGVGSLDAEALKCATVDVSVSGVGEASVFASEKVDARVTGMGDIDVYGSPKSVEKSGGLFSDVTVH
jgi:hypothetical protein